MQYAHKLLICSSLEIDLRRYIVCLTWLVARGDHFRFGSVFIKKSNQTEFFFWKKKPKPSQTDRFRFGFLRQKPIQTGLARFFQFWLGFLGFGSVFPVLARFGSVFSGFLLVSVRFGFFGFLVIKPKPNWPAGFFKNLIGFFFVRFFRFFFSGFLGLIGFPVFLLTPISSLFFNVKKFIQS